jgi:chromosome segregation ATPase
MIALRDRMKSQFIEHEDQKPQLENIRHQLRTVKNQCDTFRSTMKRCQTNLLEYSHRILKINKKRIIPVKHHIISLSLSNFLFAIFC